LRLIYASTLFQILPRRGSCLALLIPMKVVSDYDLIPVTRSDAMPVKIGAQRRWRPYRA